jgi:NAD(P)H-hydrate repair Nnr-like enzyme with NAD(P)H-hydrate epimerase domain
MVTKLSEMDVASAHMLTLAIYRYVTIPGHEAKYKFGRSDRILFAPAAEDERCTMDIFIDALIGIGAARVPTAIRK